MSAAPEIVEAAGADDMQAVRRLFRAYQEWLGVDLCFQGFEAELAGLPGAYAPPAGALLLARAPDGAAVGVVGVRPLAAPGVCEMKRLYVVPGVRGHGLGRRLAEAVIVRARAAGHRRMVLDTLPHLDAALALYRDLGFHAGQRYNDNPLDGVMFLERDLTAPRDRGNGPI